MSTSPTSLNAVGAWFKRCARAFCRKQAGPSPASSGSPGYDSKYNYIAAQLFLERGMDLPPTILETAVNHDLAAEDKLRTALKNIKANIPKRVVKYLETLAAARPRLPPPGTKGYTKPSNEQLAEHAAALVEWWEKNKDVCEANCEVGVVW